jgi:hypothetical protein
MPHRPQRTTIRIPGAAMAPRHAGRCPWPVALHSMRAAPPAVLSEVEQVAKELQAENRPRITDKQPYDKVQK